jgi:hypothetical protein
MAGEDPFLGASMVAAAITGIQSNPVMANAKVCTADRRIELYIYPARVFSHVRLSPPLPST